MAATIYGLEIYPQVGSCIQPDDWRFGSRLVASEWSEATFRLPSANYTNIQIPVNITVTGRTWQWRGDDVWVRCRIEWVQDGEPSTFSGGWLRQNGCRLVHPSEVAECQVSHSL